MSALALVTGTTTAAIVAATSTQPASATSWPTSPAYRVVNQSYSSPGTYSFVVPPGTASLTIVAQGGAGASGGGDGGGGANGAVTIFPHIDTVGPSPTVSPGDTLSVQVGGSGGHNSGSICRGGNGGNGDGTGRAGGQGGQCSFVKHGTNYLAIAGGGGGGGGQGGGAIGAGSGGTAGHDAKDDSSFATFYFGAFGQGGSSSGGGLFFAGGGGGGDSTCHTAISVSSGGNGGGAASASLRGGGGGGGGGCGAGGGGGSGFQGGGGGGGGNSAVNDGPQDFGVADGGGDGSVVVYAFQGRARTQSEKLTYSVSNGDELSTPNPGQGNVSGIEIPPGVVSMQYLAYGVPGVGGALGGLVFGTAAVGVGSGGLHGGALPGEGSQVVAGASGTAPNGANHVGGGSADCPGGAGGNSAPTEGAGQPGGGCSFVFSAGEFTAIAGGGGGNGDGAGGAAGHSGQNGNGTGGSVGACDGNTISPGQGGSDAQAGFTNGSGGGGGGCGTSGGLAGQGGANGGGGGGGANFVSNNGTSTGHTYLASQQNPDANFGFAEIWFTYGDLPAITTANVAHFTAGQSNAFEVDTDPNKFPVASLSVAGTLPSGVTFVDNGDGTGTFSGNPPASAKGAYPLTIAASNSAANTTQTFTLNVETPAAITSGDNALFPQGRSTTFTVQTTGFPTPSITETHTGSGEAGLPLGVTFHDNGDGTATISGTPDPSTHDNYRFTLTAHNGVGADAVQHFTLGVQGPPFFTSANATTFSAGTSGNFLVTTSGLPGANLQATTGPGGNTGLPPGVTFTDNGNNGTGTLSGTPTTNGVFTFQISAINVLGTAVQNFTLTVTGAPVFLSGNSYTYPGTGGAFFKVRTQAQPLATLSVEGAPASLPGGVNFTDNHDGTADISGTPTSPGATTTFTIDAKNTFGGSDHTTTQTFTFVAEGPPVFVNPDHVDFTVGTAQTFNVVIAANPAPVPPSGFLSQLLDNSNPNAQFLPNGLTFHWDGSGTNTATISGTPAAGTSGTYHITLEAQNTVNASSPVYQVVTLRVLGPPGITSPDHTIFAPGKANTFNLAANGVPSASFSATLPSGIYSLLNDGNDAGRLTGTPADSEEGAAYHFDITATNGNAPNATQPFTLNVAASIRLTPADQSVPAGNPQGYSAHAYDSNGNDLGAVTGDTTFTIADGNGCTTTPDPSSHVIFCSANVAGDHTVTGTFGDLTATAVLHVIARDPDHLILTPDPATVLTGHDQVYDVKAYDTYGNLFADVSSVLNTLGIDGVSCNRTTDTCTPSSDGPHTVTATYGTTRGTATLNSYTPVTLAQGNPMSADTTYGTAYSGNLTVTNGVGTVTWVTTPMAGDSSDVTVGSDGSISAPGTLPVGLYTVHGTNSTPRGDSGTWSFALQVNPATLTVTASDAGTPYKGPVPTSTPKYTGFVNGQDQSVLTGDAVCVVDYTVGQGAGIYPGGTHCTGGSAPNYTVDHVAGELDVFAIQLTVTASSGSGPYGSTPPDITPSYSGFVTGESEANLTTPPTCSIEPASHSNVGVYTTSCSGAVDSNYGYNYVDGSYEVTAVDLKIIAPSQSILVGDPIPASFIPTYTGLTNGDTAPSTPPTCTTTAVSSGTPNTYPITCSGAADGNYNISYQAGTLSVVRRATTTGLTVGGALPGQPIAATATVAPVVAGAAPTGTVSFYAGYVSTTNPGSLLGTSSLNGSAPDQAVLNIPHAVPGVAITAVYNGDSFYASSVSPPQTVAPPCTTTIASAVMRSLNVPRGLVCVIGTRINGSIFVSAGASLYMSNSSAGSLQIHGSAVVCGSRFSSSVMASGATGLVVIGDPREGCAPNAGMASLTFRNNTNGLVVVGNTYKSTLVATKNSGPGPLPGDTGPVIQGNVKG